MAHLLSKPFESPGVASLSHEGPHPLGSANATVNHHVFIESEPRVPPPRGTNARVVPPGLWPKRYDLMDGFRGIASLIVLFYHLGFLSCGYYGVTFFFVISGYCILASADSCQKQDHGVRAFAVKRFHRIYPPYLCAVVFFIITRILKIFISHDNQLAQYSVWQFLQNFTLTQWLTQLVHPNAAPSSLMVLAFWTVNYEVQFYFVVGIFLLVAMRTGHLSLNMLIIILTSISLIWVAWVRNFDCGLFIEYWPVFGLGCLLFMRLCQFKNRWARIATDGFLAGLAIVCMLVKFHHPYPFLIFGKLTEPLMVGACFCLFLIVLRSSSDWIAGTVAGRIISFLGLISYSLYLIHTFNLALASSVIGHILPARTPGLLVGAGLIAFHLALATVFWFFCERPFLNERKSLATFFNSTRQKGSLT